jgi:hypothetical protein
MHRRDHDHGPRKVTTWDGRDQRTISLFYPASASNPTNPPCFEVKCRKFRPNLSIDKLTKAYPGEDGSPVLVEFPPFVFAKKLPNDQIMENFVRRNMEYFLHELTVDSVGRVFQATFDEALRLRGQVRITIPTPCIASTLTLLQSRAISGALEISVLTRLASRGLAVGDQENLNIAVQDVPVSPWFGRRPVPPMMDRLLDVMWLTLAEKKRKVVLAELKKLIFKRDRKLWLEVFLTVFILMSNLEFCYKHQWRKLKRQEAVVSDATGFGGHCTHANHA